MIVVELIPVVYAKKIDSFMKKEKSILARNGINVNEKAINDSYLYVTRTYLLTVQDITPLMKKVYPSISRYDLENLKKLLTRLNLRFSSIYLNIR